MASGAGAAQGGVMPFSSTIANHRIVERIQRIRQHPDAGYGVAIGLVSLAALARLALSDYLGAQIPFITFFPAIIIATLLGGLWPGVCATILSALTAWYLFLPPAFSWELGQRELVQLLVFLFFCGINLAIVSVVNALMGGVLAREEDMRILLDCVPGGIVVIDEHGDIKLVNAGTEKLFGYKRVELLGRNVEILVPARLAEMHKAERERFLQKPEARPMGVGRDLSGRRKDGSEFPVEIDLNPISRNGRSAVLAMVIDISERQRAQQGQHRFRP
jgi:PAS domain S-box-containing protein